MDKLLLLITENSKAVRVRASHLRVLWTDKSEPMYLLYVEGINSPIMLTRESASVATIAMEQLAAEEKA